MNVLAIDTGGTHVKILATGKKTHREFSSGPTLTAKGMVSAVKKLAGDWEYDKVSIGYPGLVVHGRPVLEPHNLGPGWVGFDFAAAFKCPVKVINDAAMQALGSYKGGKMLFLGLGTGLGSAMIVDGIVVPMELAHLPYKKATYEDYVGIRGLKKHGKKRWRRHVVGRCETPDRRPRARRRGSGRRQRQETEEAASPLPRQRQRERIHRRISAVGKWRWRATTCEEAAPLVKGSGERHEQSNRPTSTRERLYDYD